MKNAPQSTRAAALSIRDIMKLGVVKRSVSRISSGAVMVSISLDSAISVRFGYPFVQLIVTFSKPNREGHRTSVRRVLYGDRRSAKSSGVKARGAAASSEFYFWAKQMAETKRNVGR